MSINLSEIYNYRANPAFQKKETDIGEHLAHEAMRQGHTTINEILQASFGGEWPPKNLNIVLDHPQAVNIKDLYDLLSNPKGLSRKEFLMDKRTPTGNAAFNDKMGRRRIGINEFKLITEHQETGYSVVNYILGHEGVHTMHADHLFENKSFKSYGIRKCDIEKEDFSPIKNYHSQIDTDDSKKTMTVFDKYLEDPRYQNTHMYEYFKTEPEVLARFHKVMMAGHREWKQLPANKEQLILALHDAGMQIPEKVLSSIKDSNTFEENSKIFSGSNAKEMHAVKQLNSIIGTISDEGKEKFYDIISPELYSNLIEMYGDKEGRTRFGLGENERYKSRVNYIIELYNKNYSIYESGITKLSNNEIRAEEKLTPDQIIEQIDHGNIAEIRETTKKLWDKGFAMISFAENKKITLGEQAYEQFKEIYTEGGKRAIDDFNSHGFFAELEELLLNT